MSLFYQHTINQTSKLGIWKIEEPENFFLGQVPLQQNITHPHKRLQHLAGRYLLKCMFPDFPYHEILIADTRKPYLPGEQYHFSISHCGNYAAAIVSSDHRVGIDIEIPSVKVQRISHKFIHENEKQWLVEFSRELQTSPGVPRTNFEPASPTGRLQTILWSAKEAVFKWYSLGEVDFKNHIQVYGKIETERETLILPFKFLKHGIEEVKIYSRTFESLVMSWLATGPGSSLITDQSLSGHP